MDITRASLFGRRHYLITWTYPLSHLRPASINSTFPYTQLVSLARFLLHILDMLDKEVFSGGAYAKITG